MLTFSFRALAVVAGILISTAVAAQSESTSSDGFIAVSGGFKHICAIDADGDINCSQASDALRLEHQFLCRR